MNLNRSPFYGLVIIQMLMQAWLIWVVHKGYSPEALILLMVAIGLLAAHLTYLNHRTFIAEIFDLNRGPSQPVMVFGETISKNKDAAKVDEASNFWNTPQNRQMMAGGVWVIALWLCVKSVGHISIASISIAIVCWLSLHCRRLLQLLWVNGLTLLILIIASDTTLQKLISCGLFLLFLAVYRQCLIQYSQGEKPFRLSKALTFVLPSLFVFGISFIMASYILPDNKIEERKSVLKDKIAQRIANRANLKNQVAQNAPSGGAAGSGGDSSRGSGSGSNSGNSSTASSAQSGQQQTAQNSNSQQNSASSGNTSQQAPQSTGDTSQSKEAGGSPNSAGNQNTQTAASKESTQTANNAGGGGSEGGSNGEQSVSNSPTSSEVQKASELQKENEFAAKQKLEQEQFKWRLRLDSLEKILKLILFALAAWFVLKLFSKKKISVTKNIRKKKSRESMAELREKIKNYQSQKYASRKDEIIAAYHLLLTLLKISGVTKQDWQTPKQFDTEVEKVSPIFKKETKVLTPLFVKVYYGEEPVSDQEYSQFREASVKLAKGIQI